MKKELMVAMKQHGNGLKHLEAMTLKYGEEMLHTMEGYIGKAFDPAQILVRTVASIMLTLIYGNTTMEEAEKFIHLQDRANKVFQPNGIYFMLDLLPISRFIIPPSEKGF